MLPRIEVTITLTYGEAYWAGVVITTRWLRKVLYIVGGVALLWLSVLALIVLRPRPASDWQRLSQANAFPWVLGGFLFFVFGVPALTAHKVTSSPRNTAGFHYVFSETGILIESSQAKVDLQWSTIREALETERSFFLFVGPSYAHTIPKRCLQSANDVGSLRELLRSRVTTSKLRLP